MVSWRRSRPRSPSAGQSKRVAMGTSSPHTLAGLGSCSRCLSSLDPLRLRSDASMSASSLAETLSTSAWARRSCCPATKAAPAMATTTATGRTTPPNSADPTAGSPVSRSAIQARTVRRQAVLTNAATGTPRRIATIWSLMVSSQFVTDQPRAKAKANEPAKLIRVAATTATNDPMSHLGFFTWSWSTAADGRSRVGTPQNHLGAT